MADPDLQIRGRPRYPAPEISGGGGGRGGLQFFFRPFGPHFSQQIWGDPTMSLPPPLSLCLYEVRYVHFEANPVQLPFTFVTEDLAKKPVFCCNIFPFFPRSNGRDKTGPQINISKVATAFRQRPRHLMKQWLR